MTYRKIVPFLVAGALTLVAALGVFTYQTVRAQAPTETPTTPSQVTPGTDQQAAPFGWKGMRGGMKGGATEQDLADALGVTLDKLQAAEQTASDEALKQAVDQGLITQAQADALKASGRAFRGAGHIGAVSGIDYHALLANALGISADQLKAAQLKAFSTSLDRAVQAGTLTQEQADLMKARQALYNDAKFQSSLKSAYEAAVQQAVTDGILTQAQADQILQENATRGFPGMFGGRGGRGGRHGGGFFGIPGGPVTPANPNPASPASDGA